VWAFIIVFVEIDAVEPHHREFSLTDTSIMYTFAVRERVPAWSLAAYVVFTPFAIVLVWALFIPPTGSVQRRRWMNGSVTWREKFWDANVSALAFALAIASTLTVTNILKNLVGRPRPGRFL
jgi:hypothetical protein